MKQQLVFATNNLNKLREVQKILGVSFSIQSLSDIGFSGDIPEDQETIEGNALQKAEFLFDKKRLNVFADDTGLEVEVLDGAPGVYSARYAGEEKDPEKNMTKLLSELENQTNRKARFKTVIALIFEGKKFSFEGICNGQIALERKGEKGFGYDPIFIPEGYETSFAEMDTQLKNEISHRALATKKLVDFLQNL